MAFYAVSSLTEFRGYGGLAEWLAAGRDPDAMVDIEVTFNVPPILDSPAYGEGPPTHAFGFYSAGGFCSPLSLFDVPVPPRGFRSGNGDHQGPQVAVRSQEIRTLGGLTVRMTPFEHSYTRPVYSDDPEAEGLGRLVAVVPYTVEGSTVRFSMPSAARPVGLLWSCSIITFEAGVIDEANARSGFICRTL